MKKTNRIITATITFGMLISIAIGFYLGDFFDFSDWINIIMSIGFFGLTILLMNEIIHWVKEGKRAETLDFIMLFFLFVTVYILTEDIMNSVIGAFSIYLLFGIMELKEYEVLNKVLIITVVTYNFIFFAGLINSYLRSTGAIDSDIIRDTAFSMSIWIMLILGFILFGRKYIVVFRFMSPQYLSLFLFVIAWLAVRLVSKWFFDITEWIYFALIITNWFVYFISGPTLDFTLGIKKTDNPEILSIVDEVKQTIGIKGKVRVGFGKYPILNAMAYGAWFDKRIAVIAPQSNSIPKDELKGIIGHELSHTKGGIKKIPDTLMLTIVSTVELAIFWVLGWPATMYDYTFNPENQPFPIWVFLLINIAVSIILYIFVRVLEGYADLNTKKVGLSNELAKGLYNLEGFYSSGREIGLDTMLLCEEEIKPYNRISNYANTAEYLNQNMYQPKRSTLLSNLLNSHPPTYHRILSMYSSDSNQITPWRESILPFSLMNKKKRKKFAIEYEEARMKFIKMSNSKFESMFEIKEYSEYLDKLNKKELYENKVNKTYVFVDNKNHTTGLVYLKDIKYNDDITAPISFECYSLNLSIPEELRKRIVKTKDKKLILQSEEIEQLKTLRAEIIENQKGELVPILLNPLYVSIYLVDFKATYQIDKTTKGNLLSIIIPSTMKKITDEKQFSKLLKKECFGLYIDNNGKLIKTRIGRKLKFNMDVIDNSVEKEVFLEENGTLKILNLMKYEKTEDFESSKLLCKEINKNTIVEIDSERPSDNEPKRNFSLKDLIITTDEFSFILHNDELTYEHENRLLTYLMKNNLRTTVFLKKAVNNQETGYIKEILISEEDRKNKSELMMMTIQGEEVSLYLNKIELVLFAEKTICLAEKSKMSLGQKISKKILKWRKPSVIFNP